MKRQYPNIFYVSPITGEGMHDPIVYNFHVFVFKLLSDQLRDLRPPTFRQGGKGTGLVL